MLQGFKMWWTVNFEFHALPLISAGEILMFPPEIIMVTDYIHVLDYFKAFNSLSYLTSLILWKDVQLVL